MRRWLPPLAAVLLALALLAASCTRVAAAGPDVVSIEALPYGGGTYRVSVLFPTVLRDKSGKAAVADLFRRSGWNPSSILWIQTPALKRFPALTGVEFTVNTLYPRGEFPAEAMGMAFRQWGGVDISVAHDGGFRYNGPPHNENADATMDVATGTHALNVFIRIKNPRLQSLGFAALSAPPTTGAGFPVNTAPPSRRPRQGVPPWIVILVGLPLAGLTSLFVYLYLDGKRHQTP